MSKILIVYSSTDGHTLKICQRLKDVVEVHDHQVTLFSTDENSELDFNSFDKIVIGSRIRYGKHSPQIYDFIHEYQPILDTKPNAFFSVNVVARKPEKNTPETNPYMIKFLKQSTWIPKQAAVFAGKIHYQKYKFWDRQIIRFIMWMTKGPTDLDTNIEFTDWKQVEAFGDVIHQM